MYNLTMEVRIKDIKVKKRIRKDMGDISKLKQSLQSIGLINPILLDSTNTLISGERRFEAAKSLGWKTIEAKVISEKDKLKKLNLELEENLIRKDFTYQEIEEGLRQKRRMEIKRSQHPVVKFFSSFFEWIIDILDAIFKRK